MSTELTEIEDAHGRKERAGFRPGFDGHAGRIRRTFPPWFRRRRRRGRRVTRCGTSTARFPIHGIDAVIGIRPTILPWLVLGGGLAGLLTGMGLQWFCNAYDYPLIVSGKPMWSFAANVVIIFECTVLFASLTAVFGMLGLNRLPLLYNPMFKSAKFQRVTQDRFFIWISKDDAKFDETKTEEFLKSVGATSVERIED